MKSTMPERLAQAREARKFSRRGLSLAAGVAQALVGQVESGVIKDPGASTLEKLAVALDVSIDWIVTGEGRGPKSKAKRRAA